MPKQNLFNNITTLDVMCASVEVYKSQGFIKSGHGYTDNNDPENPVKIEDNKTNKAIKSRDGGVATLTDNLTKLEYNEMLNALNEKERSPEFGILFKRLKMIKK